MILASSCIIVETIKIANGRAIPKTFQGSKKTKDSFSQWLASVPFVTIHFKAISVIYKHFKVIFFTE